MYEEYLENFYYKNKYGIWLIYDLNNHKYSNYYHSKFFIFRFFKLKAKKKIKCIKCIKLRYYVMCG